MNGEKDALRKELHSLKYGVLFSASLIALAVSALDNNLTLQVASAAIGFFALILGAFGRFFQ